MLLTVLFFMSLALFSFFALHQKKNTEAAIQEVMDHYSVGQIYAEYKSHNRNLWGFTIAGIALTAGFAVTYFSGTEINPKAWTTEQWIFASIGLLVTIAITNGQRKLYQNVQFHGVAFFITLVILSFVYMSEISTQGERSEALMKDRSLKSPTLLAVLKGIENTTAQQKSNPYTSRIAEAERLAAEHESKLAECETKYASEKRKIKCREFERAKMNGYKQQAEVYKSQAGKLVEKSGQTVLSLVAEGKKLEHNEENYAAFIKFVKNVFAVSAPSALNFVAFILVNAFEVLFHFIGVRTGILKEALLRSGYNFDPDPPTPEDINAEIQYKRAKHRAKLEKKRKKYELPTKADNSPPLPEPDDNNSIDSNDSSDSESVPANHTKEKKRMRTGLTDRTDTLDTGNGEPDKVDRTGQMCTDGKNRAWFPEIVYMAVREAILSERIKPTVRPTHFVVSEGLKEGLFDEKGKHRYYTKPETQEVAEFILAALLEERVLLLNKEGGIGKAKYLLNRSHPEALKAAA